MRVTALYLATSWLILQVSDLVFDAFLLPAWSMRILITVLALGLPAVIALSWIYELTPILFLMRKAAVSIPATTNAPQVRMTNV